MKKSSQIRFQFLLKKSFLLLLIVVDCFILVRLTNSKTGHSGVSEDVTYRTIYNGAILSTVSTLPVVQIEHLKTRDKAAFVDPMKEISKSSFLDLLNLQKNLVHRHQ